MTRAWTLLGTLALLLLPLVAAHTPAGTPKNYCEPMWEWNVHEYAGVGGPLAHMDGNRIADCDDAFPQPDYDGHQEYAAGGALLYADHHTNHICVDNATSYEVYVDTVWDGIYFGGCNTVTLALVKYEVVVLQATVPAGHISTW